MKYLLPFIIFLLVLVKGTYSYAQNCNEKLEDAKKAIMQSKYDLALKKLAAVEMCDHFLGYEVERLRRRVFERMEQEKRVLEQKLASNKSNEKAIWGTSLNCYDEFINKGDSLFRTQNFLDAINQFEAAKRCDDFSEKERKAGVNTSQEKINECLNFIEEQRIDLAKALVTTDSALQKAQKLIDAFYFYADRFALAYSGPLKRNEHLRSFYYFIDKNGNQVSKLGKWEKAEFFDRKGLAKVQKRDFFGHLRNYLLDTLGNTYLVAYDIESLSNPLLGEITALDLSGKQLTIIPDEVFNLTSLKILRLNNNRLSRLTIQIEKLRNLEILDLSSNQLDRRFLSGEVVNLKSLKRLDLTNNSPSSLIISYTWWDDEGENIKRLLPGCDVEFGEVIYFK